MTQQGVKDLYMWQMATWPSVIRVNASEAFTAAKIKELAVTYQYYKDQEVFDAFSQWADDNKTYPSTAEIKHLIKYNKIKAQGLENEKYWPMCFIDKEGHEYCWGLFTRADFISNKHNPSRLQPEEWERRFKATRRHWYKENGYL